MKYCSEECKEIYPYYGVAPHKHVGVTNDPRSFIGSTRVIDKAEWPKNFVEDKEAPGCGVYYCPICLRESPNDEAEHG